MSGSPADSTVRASLDVTNDPTEIEHAEDRVLHALTTLGYPRASLFAVRLCLHEAVSNGFRHGHRNLPPGTPVHLSFDASPTRIVIEVADQGPGFDPQNVPDPTTEENLERGSGRGLLLIRAYMSEATYNANGNMLRMVYRRPKEA